MNRRRPHHGSWMDVVRSYSWHRRSLDRDVAKISFSISGLAVLAALIWCCGKHDFYASGHDKLILRRHIGNQQKSGMVTQRGVKYIPLLGVIRLALENIWIFQRYQTV